MSTLSNLGAVAGGIMGGMSMRQAMEQKNREEERLNQQMQWQREEHDYRLSERERAAKEREAGDAYQSELTATKFMQPGDPGKESVMVPADPNAPDEPTMGVDRASQTPRAEIAKIGMQEAFKQKPMDYRAAARKDAEVLGNFEMKAQGLRGPERDRALSMVAAKKKSLIDGYTAQFPGGNPSADPIAFSNYLTDVLAPFGAATMTPERAMKENEFAKAYKDQNTVEALELLQKGDKEGAIKLYCSKGDHCFADVILTPEDSKLTNIKSFNAIGIDKDGNPHQLGNVYDAMQEIKTRGKTAELAMQKAKLDSESANFAADNARQDKALNENVRHNKVEEVIQSTAAKKAAKSSSPAQVQTAEWLFNNKVAKDLNQAWEMVGTSKEKSHDAAVQDIAAKLMNNLMYANNPDKAKADAERIVGEIRGSAQPSDNYQQFKSAWERNKDPDARRRIEAEARRQGLIK